MSHPSHRTLSVVVCCYSQARWDLLQKAIASLRNQVRPIDEFILVVDHNDLLFERLRGSSVDATVVANDGQQGLSHARNTGVRHATSDIVAFLDDDVEASPNWSHQLMQPYLDLGVLGVGGRVVPRFESERPRWLPPELDWVVGCTYVGHRSSRGPVRNFIGANMSFRRSVFDAIAGFRSDLGRTESEPAGCEETELCIRATRELGGEMFYEPDAIVHHFVPDTRATREYLHARCYAEGRSKATIAQIVGRERGLASERSYLTRVLPRAIGRELSGAFFVRRRGAFGRIRTIIEAVAFTTTGYIRARFTTRATRTSFDPVFVTEIDIDHPVDIRPGLDQNGRPYRRALALARRRGRPLGVVECAVPDGGLPRARVKELVAFAGGAPADPPATPLVDPAPHLEALPFVSVVVATRDRPDALHRCLESLARLDYPSFEIIVVDNCPSSSETAELVTRFARSSRSVRYVREDTPGLARAHNRGLLHATGAIVAFTDDDVVVDRGWLGAITEVFRDDPTVGCVTGMIMPAELETASQAWSESWAGFGKGVVRRRYEDGAGPSDDPLFPFTAGAFGSGANMALRADVLQAIGGFDPALGTGTPARGGDDLATFFDVITAGFVLVYEPSAVVFHAPRPDYASLRHQAFGYGVGMGAYAAHVLKTHPRRVLGARSRMRPAARHYFAADSAKNKRRPTDFPRELVWRERAGLFLGPWRYWRSGHSSESGTFVTKPMSITPSHRGRPGHLYQHPRPSGRRYGRQAK